ncbi:MAG: class I tRNA ligase family protein, partial [Psychroflexus maritimus]
MALATKYNAKEVEDKWYQFWLDQGFFNSEVNDKPAYTIVIPPPNVTGILHMGHMLNNTIQDVLIRRARLQGFNACWVPGTDHASIATEAKVVAKLKAEGIDKSSISRDEFLKHAWDWTHNYGGKILDQLKKLGASCDWNRVKFTMDEDLYTSVIHSFVDLYEKGKIYRGHRMVNWDPEAKTTLSDEEIIYQEKNGNLYYINYPIEGSEECLSIATTRPETIFGDTAICIHPEDERYQHLKGKHAVVPVVG